MLTFRDKTLYPESFLMSEYDLSFRASRENYPPPPLKLVSFKMEFITLIMMQSASEEADLTSGSLLRLRLSPAGQSASHQWALSSSRSSTRARTSLPCRLQRLASTAGGCWQKDLGLVFLGAKQPKLSFLLTWYAACFPNVCLQQWRRIKISIKQQ